MQPQAKQQQQLPLPAPAPTGWARVLASIDWSVLVIMAGMGLGVALVDKAPPVQRPVFVLDAAIALPKDPHTMPFWLALLVPFLLLAATSAALELGPLRRAQGAAGAVAAVVNCLLNCAAALGVTGFLTEFFKRHCGRLRPDFLATCQPLDLPNSPLVPPFPGGSLNVIACSNPATSKVDDARMSFPSGHSSCAMAVGLYAALYTLWCVYVRGRSSASSSSSKGSSSCGTASLLSALSNPAGGHAAAAAAQQQQQQQGCGHAVLSRVAAEAASLALLAVVLFELAWPWGVAASRFIDNRHNVSDIVGGMLLGLCIAPVFVLRLAGRSAGGGSVVLAAVPAAVDGVLDDGAVLPVAAV